MLKSKKVAQIDPASFRDPSGFIFRSDRDGCVYRQINRDYERDYRMLMDGGLYNDLVDAELLIPHEEVDRGHSATDDAFLVIRPQELPFVSYPYEWSFSALKAAALLTLEVQLRAIEHGMTLKDASCYNVQFEGFKPVFIDTLSFEQWEEGSPWVAYRQFCQHFIAPLALMAKTDVALGRLLALYIDGIPLAITAKLLPRITWLNAGLLAHIHLHARMERRYSDTSTEAPLSRQRLNGQIPLTRMVALLRNLAATVNKLRWSKKISVWSNYYDDNSYSRAEFQNKESVVESFLRIAAPTTIWDLGANTGRFASLATQQGIRAYAFDVDPLCVEQGFRASQKTRNQLLLPLLLDLTNPSPSLGWANEERPSLFERGPVDLVIALALIHHLAISNNIPLPKTALLLRRLTPWLIIEFIPKHDPQVQRLMRSRKDIFTSYSQVDFERAFGKYFHTVKSEVVSADGRILYLLTANDAEPSAVVRHSAGSPRNQHSS